MHVKTIKLQCEFDFAYFIFISLISSSCSLRFEGDHTNYNLRSCMDDLTQSILAPDGTIYFIYENNQEIYIPIQITNPRVIMLMDIPLQLKLSPHSNYIIYTMSHSSLNNTMRKLQKYSIWDESLSPRGKFLIVVHSQNDLQNIFKTLFNFDIINIAVVVCNESTCTAYSWNLFYEGCECGKNPQPYLLSNCGKNSTLAFHNYLNNLNGCKIKLVSKFKFERNFRQSPISTILVKLVEILSDFLNTSMQDIVTENLKEFLYDKQEGISFGIVYLRLQKSIEQYDLSDVVHQDVSVWAVPKPQQITNVKVTVSVFKRTVWGAIIIMFITVAFTWWLSAKWSYQNNNFKDFLKCCFAVLSFSVGGSTNIKTITNSAKCIVLSYLFYCIVISTSFQANLISGLTHPTYEHGISTLEELWESKLYLLVHEGGRYNTSLNINNRIVIENQLNLTHTLGEVAFNRNSATPVGKRGLRVFAKEDSLIGTIESISLGNLELTAIMRKGHYFMPTFNKYVKRLVESGFREKVLSDAEGWKYTSRKEKLKVALTLEHLASAFTLLGIGLSCAILVFMLEIYCLHYIQN